MRPALARLSLVVSLAAPLGGVACSQALRAGDSGAPLLVFSNESLDMTTVYAIRSGGNATRIASVMPGRTDTLSLPGTVSSASEITIIAVPTAGARVASSGPISLGPGVRLAITLRQSQNILSVLPISTP